MGRKRIIHKLTGKWTVSQIGNKAESLLFLRKNSFPIPSTWIVTADAYQSYREEGFPFLKILEEEVSSLPDLVFAVRSSTNLEDGENVSYAGQFRTMLHVKGKEQILQSILEVWESAAMEKEGSYPKEKSNSAVTIRFAVIIQEMIHPLLSGVGFSRNPVTNLNEVIVEAVEGIGEDLVQKGVTPLRWRTRGERLLEGESSYRYFPVIQKVFSAIRALKKTCKKDIDMEWAYNGEKLYFLQLRSITGSGARQIYSSRMAREMLPGLIKPLVWSVNIPLVNGIWIGIIEEITGKLEVKPEELAKSFHYRTYFNLAALGELFGKIGFSAESLEAIMTNEEESMSHFRPGIKSVRHTFRFVRFMLSKLGFERYYLRRIELLRKELEILKERISREFSVGNYPVLFDALFETAGKMVYLNIFVPMLMRYYDKKLRKKLDHLKIDYGKLDFTRDFPLLSTYSPHLEMEKIRKELDKLPPGMLSSCESLEMLKKHPEATPVPELFEAFLKKFGHLSESGNDFSIEKWEENPELIFHMISNLPPPSPTVELNSLHEAGIPRHRRRAMRKLYGKAGRFRFYREQTSFLYIFGYGLFRSLFLRVGDELVRAGILEQRNDVFFLTRLEINKILEKGLLFPHAEYALTAIKRKKEMEEVRDLILPSVIIGEEAPEYDQEEKRNFRGVGTSPGRYTGKVTVISGIPDFKKMEKGDVLVIPFSDVSWTPILVHAGAIISEAGGLLSHCSIIAREMSIPAVVSVDYALSLKDGMRVTVDGSNGIITTYGDN